jgi:hypothetical protein
MWFHFKTFEKGFANHDMSYDQVSDSGVSGACQVMKNIIF